MADGEVKSFEISYLINPEIPEDEVFGEAGKVTSAIQEVHGLVGRIEEPKKRKLAYPILKHKNAYFGWTTFTIAPERLADIEKRLKREPNIIRSSIVHEVKRPEFEFRPRAPRPGSAGAETVVGDVKAFEPQAPKEEDHAKMEELDKRLEEILGK